MYFTATRISPSPGWGAGAMSTRKSDALGKPTGRAISFSWRFCWVMVVASRASILSAGVV